MLLMAKPRNYQQNFLRGALHSTVYLLDDLRFWLPFQIFSLPIPQNTSAFGKGCLVTVTYLVGARRGIFSGVPSAMELI